MVDVDNYLMAAGGENGIYVCEVSIDARQFALSDSTRSSTETVTVLSGQPVVYVLRHTVALSTLLRAAHWFFEHRNTDPSLAWEPY